MDRAPFALATKAALNATGRASEIGINAHVQVGCGISYSSAEKPAVDIVGVEGCEHGLCGPDDSRTSSARRFHPWSDLKRHCWVHGSLWWLRHWAGAFLADKMLRAVPFPDLSASDGAPVSRDRLFAWLQKDMRWCIARLPECDADFDHISALHGALFHTIGQMAPLAGYPAEFAQEVCPDDAPTVYECRHGVGHGVLYAVWLQRPELAGKTLPLSGTFASFRDLARRLRCR